MTYIFDPERYSGMPRDSVRREVGAQIERMIEYLDNLDPWDEREPEYDGCELELWEGDGLESGEGDDCDYEGDGQCDDEPSDNGIADIEGVEEQGLKWAGLEAIHAQMGWITFQSADVPQGYARNRAGEVFMVEPTPMVGATR